MTVRHRFFGEDTHRYFHILWDQVSSDKNRQRIMREVARTLKELDKKAATLTPLSEKEEKLYSRRFLLEFYPTTRILKSYQQIHEVIDKEVSAEGFYILVSSEEMSCLDAVNAYSKRDCVEKSFRALKTNIGMDAIRAHSDESAGGRIFISFISSIMRAVIFHGLKYLRSKDRKNFTVPAVIRELEKIEVLRDYKTQTYSRRYKLTAKQKKIYDAFSLKELDVDEILTML